MNRRSWFPNFLTTANLFCGFLAILFIIQSKAHAGTDHSWFIWAGLTICLAALLDALDGRLARVLDGSSAFGKELDSLADLVSFGVAPAVLVYEYAFHDDALKVLWMVVCGLFVCCGAGRLARYNLGGLNSRFFSGIPIPAAGLTVTGLAIFPSNLSTGVMAAVVLVCAFLMISTLRYPHLDQLIFEAPPPIRLLFMSLFVICLVAPQDWFYMLPVSYIVYGLLTNLISALRPKEA